MSRALVVNADGPGTAAYDPRQAAVYVGAEDVELLVGWLIEDVPWLCELAPGSTRSVMGGYALTRHIERGAVEYLPVRLASMPRLLRGALRPDVAVVHGRPAGRGFAFATSIGWSHAAAHNAGAVVVVVDEDIPDLGGPAIPGNIIATVRASLAYPPPQFTPNLADETIGQFVVSLLPAHATIQYGPGGIGDRVLSAVDRPVAVWSGLVTDALARLAGRGMLVGQATATYLWGGTELSAMAASGALRIRPLEETHALGTLTAIPNLVTINTALQVDLHGSVNIETVGGRPIAGIGGHADFCSASSFNPTGTSIIALRAQNHGRSTIVPTVEIVSTGRTDVDLVVTEYGIADLRGVGDDERTRRLIQVAAPDHREALERTARQGRG